MFPILLKVGPISIYTLGIFLMIGFLWGSYILWKHARLTSFQESEYFDAGFIAIFIGILTSRIFYVAVHFKNFGFDPLKFILVNGYPGASMIGFLLGFLFTILFISYKKTGNLYKFAEYYLAPLVLAIAIAKLGSFFAGVDVGTKTKFLLSVKYIGHSGMRHITAIYESILYLISYVFISNMIFRVRREDFKPGSVFFLFLVCTGLINILLDNLKQNHIYFGPIPINYTYGIIGFIVGCAYFLIFYRSAILQKINQIYEFVKNYAKRTNTRSESRV